MIFDSKGKLFGKISIVDIIILVVIVAAVGLVGYKFTKSGTESPFAKADEVQLQFYGEEVPDFTAVWVKKGDIVKDSVKLATFGNVKDVKIDKSVSWAPNVDGKYVQSSKAGFSSITITVEGEGKLTNNGLTVGNAEYYIGQSINLRVGNTAFYIKISDIKKKG